MRVIAALLLMLIGITLVASPPAGAQTQQTLTLEAAMTSAVDRHPSVVAASRAVQAAEARLVQARAGTSPQVSLTGRASVGTLGSTGTPTGGEAASSHNVALGATLPLYDGGITRERIREAELRVEQLKVLEAQMRQRIELDVRQAWLAIEQASGELAAAGKGVDQAREATRIAGVRYQAGVGTLLEVTSAQASLAQAEFSLASARFTHHLARVQVILAVGGAP